MQYRLVRILSQITPVFIAAPAVSASFEGTADPAAVVVAGKARFTMLAPGLVRMEYSPDGGFEDRPSFVFVNRKQPVPKSQVTQIDRGKNAGEEALIATNAVTLRYVEDGKPFSRENLSIKARVGNRQIEWKPGDKAIGDLKGTWRTLDGVSGASQLESGLLSRAGWTLIDDSQRLLFDTAGAKPGEPLADWPWATPREKKDRLDWYFFAYGNDYLQCLRDFTAVAGKIPLPPRYAFGAWWSRYWAYSDAELRQLVNEFRQNDVPLEVLVVDMDWHLDGWTGYTWNPKYFPDPDGFLKWTKEEGLRVPLNLHPADGVGKHEKAFEAVCQRMGLDPKTTPKVPFDCTDRKYVDAYFQELHHPLERQGIDFWWMDWQQGQGTKIAGLDPLPWLNYLHWTDWEREPGAKESRPLIFSRWGGLGNHRYQIGFSGDTFCNWQSLAFQPYFTATAGNVCYPFWSHDIGGHMPGPVDPELYVRWIQWGALSPMLRTHTTKNPLAERRIWAFPSKHFEAMRAAWRFRYSLLPYIYTAARQAHDTAMPLCRPMYLLWPEMEEAYAAKNQYMYGDDLLVAPVITPAEPSTGLASTEVWVPPGKWTHWFTGKVYEGPGSARVLSALNQMPLLVRDGAIIPTTEVMRNTSEKPEIALTFEIFGGASGKSRVYEDDGLSQGYLKGECAWTPVAFERVGSGLVRVTIGPAQGTYSGMDQNRSYAVRVHDVMCPKGVKLNGKDIRLNPTGDNEGWVYVARELAAVARTADVAITNERVFEFTFDEAPKFRAELREGGESVRRLAASLGNECPAPLKNAMEKMSVADRNWESIEDTLTPLRGQTRSLLTGITPEMVKRPAVREAVARLLGLDLEFEIVPMRTLPSSPRTIDRDSKPGHMAKLEARIAPPLGLDSAIAIAVDIEPIEGWELDKALSAKTTIGDARSAVLAMRPSTGIASATIRGVVSIKGEGLSLDFPVERSISPSISRWWVFGPFDGELSKSLVTEHPPEGLLMGDDAPDAAAMEKAGGKRVERTFAASDDPTSEFVVNFNKVFEKPRTNAVAYGFVYLVSEKDADAVLAMGSDDGCVVWLNGKEVHRVKDPRAYNPKADRVKIRLNKGVNRLLIKVNQGVGGWEFAAHIDTPEGQPMTGVRAEWEASSKE